MGNINFRNLDFKFLIGNLKFYFFKRNSFVRNIEYNFLIGNLEFRNLEFKFPIGNQ